MIPICIPTYSKRYTGSGFVRLGNSQFRRWTFARLGLCIVAMCVTSASISWEYLNNDYR